jgi:hypothetical protein
MLLGAKAGDIIWYFKTDAKENGGVSIINQDISISKYKEMLMQKMVQVRAISLSIFAKSFLT